MKFHQYFIVSIVLPLLVAMTCIAPVQAKSIEGTNSHINDMFEVYPFEWDQRIYSFYKEVCYFLDHPNGDPFSQKPLFVVNDTKLQNMTFANHRIWYHWGFNKTDVIKLKNFSPLSEAVSENIRYGKLAKSDEEYFWFSLLLDVRRRNRDMMNKAAKIFGYDELGSISSLQRSQLNAFVSILYDVHILGDYTTPEKTLLINEKELYSDMATAIRNLAGENPDNKKLAEQLIEELQQSQTSTDTYLATLKSKFGKFFISLHGPMYDYSSRFSKQGFIIKKELQKEDKSFLDLFKSK